ncbi:receptor-like protein kinase FERONIA [Actinidia eriantha]|uniref:receptor-like protein kinase FERONIA n=1 Tax=Actinidia eriantha TaxID=165200 RepID=UPI00259066EF|nr:receptor-like protein kinase FERONIA [Actinidia eriantha]
MSLTPMYLFSFVFLWISISCNAESRYNPPDNIAVDCGSSGTSLAQDRRSWEGDINSNKSFLEILDSNSSITREAQTQPIDKVPYFTARISRSEFTYVIPVTSTGPKFVRLHFFHSSYQDFDPSTAIFTVKANQFTLLSNFSASLTAASLGQQTIAKEFCMNVEGDRRVNITFTPSETPPNAHAFINGIEIVSIPTNLYYGWDEPNGFKWIGYEGNPYHLGNDKALEMVYRLNVGGSLISPMEDTGMYRKWIEDDGYCNFVGALPVSLNRNPSFTTIPNYTAPDNVYQTARSMGNNATINYQYNLTWGLAVDSGFTYMVRLHFCEIEKNITKGGDREFLIYITNQIAEPQADVIVWSGGNGFPVYKDYAVTVPQGTEKKQNLSVALHPASNTRTLYSDAILNGIEVFKLSDYYGNLAGPNPDQPPPATTVTPGPILVKRKSNPALIPAITGGVISGLIVLFLLGLLIFRRGRREKDSLSYVAVDRTKTGASSLPSDVCRHFSLHEIRAATNNFNSAFIIGRGGFGVVYKGCTNGGSNQVAIKRLKPGSQQGAHEFMTEIEMLSHLRYLHLVSLIGYCSEDHEMILVYDYMSRGTLRDHLYNSDNPPLSWKKRLQICIGAAKGLHYLHAGAKRMIIHRDVKTTNILLDDKWLAKVSDFGLSKANPNNMSNTHISTVVKGSIGYLDPEYYRRQQLTEKSDVYSFGVVLFEVLCARPPVDKTLESNQVSLAAWARSSYENGTLDQIVDGNLKGEIAPECLKKFGEIAISCLHDEGIKRPSMNDVVWNLEFALQLQEIAIDGTTPGGDQEGFKDHDALIFNGKDDEMVENGGQISSNGVTMTSNSGTTFTSSFSGDRMSSGLVFSEIMEPRAR